MTHFERQHFILSSDKLFNTFLYRGSFVILYKLRQRVFSEKRGLVREIEIISFGLIKELCADYIQHSHFKDPLHETFLSVSAVLKLDKLLKSGLCEQTPKLHSIFYYNRCSRSVCWKNFLTLTHTHTPSPSTVNTQ